MPRLALVEHVDDDDLELALQRVKATNKARERRRKAFLKQRPGKLYQEDKAYVQAWLDLPDYAPVVARIILPPSITKPLHTHLVRLAMDAYVDALPLDARPNLSVALVDEDFDLALGLVDLRFGSPAARAASRRHWTLTQRLHFEDSGAKAVVGKALSDKRGSRPMPRRRSQDGPAPKPPSPLRNAVLAPDP